MATNAPSELHRFRDFIERQIENSSGDELTPEQVLELWTEQEATIQSIERGLSDIEAGRTHSAEEVFESFRVEPDAGSK